MIAQLLILAAAVLPPEGPLLWKGEEVRLNPPMQRFRIIPTREPEPVKETERRFYGTHPDGMICTFAANSDPAAAFAVSRALASFDHVDMLSHAPTNRFAAGMVLDHPDPDDDARQFKSLLRIRKEFETNVKAAGCDYSFNYVPRETFWPWWNLVWSGDEIYDWMFSKITQSVQ